ncbi:MAG: hypothetical protein AAGA37_07165 [Actinomycetota bacterium]
MTDPLDKLRTAHAQATIARRRQREATIRLRAFDEAIADHETPQPRPGPSETTRPETVSIRPRIVTERHIELVKRRAEITSDVIRHRDERARLERDIRRLTVLVTIQSRRSTDG